MFIYFLFQMILYHLVRHIRYFLLPFAGLYEHLVCYRVSRLIIAETNVAFLPFRMINDEKGKKLQVIDIFHPLQFDSVQFGSHLSNYRQIYMFRKINKTDQMSHLKTSY